MSQADTLDLPVMSPDADLPESSTQKSGEDLFLTVESKPVGTTPGRWADWFGLVASIACAIHCAAMPFVIAFLPALGLSFLADESFHKVMVGVCSLFAIAAFIPGWRRHRQLLPTGIAVAGLSLISFGAFAFVDECCANHAVAAENGAASSSGCCATEETASCCSGGAEPVTPPGCCGAAQTTAASPMVGAANPDSSASLASFGWLVPWITPLGGLSLVIAHLLNRRYSCLCGCCDAESRSGFAV